MSVKACLASSDRGLRGVCHAAAAHPERREEVESAVAQRLAVRAGQVASSAPAEPVASAAGGRWARDAHRGGASQESAELQSEREAVDAAAEDRAFARRVFHRHSVWQEVWRDARPWVVCVFRAVDQCEGRSARAWVAVRPVQASAGDQQLAACAPVAWVNWAACWDSWACLLAS